MDENINQTPAEYTETENESPGFFTPKKIISLVIGLIVFGLLVSLIFFVVIPRLGSSKSKNADLTYWILWEDPAIFQVVADEFMQQNPEIKVKIEKQDIKSLGKYIDRLTTRIGNSSGPDIFQYHNSWLTELKQVVLPLPQDVVKKVELEDKFYPVVASDLKIDGAYYGLPVNFDTLSFFVNTQLFKNSGLPSYPTNWEDLVGVAKQLTVKDANGKITTSGIALGTYDNIAHAPDIISLLFVLNGADIKNLSGPSRDNAVDALDFYTAFAKGEDKVWDSNMENSKLAFARGNLAMYIGYSWDIFEIKALNPDLQFEVLPVPGLSKRNNTIASYWVMGVSNKTKFSTQAFQFMEFMALKENMQKLFAAESKTRLFGELYPRKDLAESLKSNKLIYPFVLQGEDAVSTIFSSDTYDDAMVDALNVYLGNAIRSIVNDNGSGESSIDTLSGGVSQILNRYAGQ